ncbi:MAG TPA: transglycosylase SLT domain-containing protein, partial [Chryseolinea sp.]|nr:transglycosylase SLT domain-containing protein [Chryseolinea sp.]
MRLFFSVFLIAGVSVQAQTPQVPHKMEFAGMTLTIRDDARREIQKDVNALTQSPKHHNIKIERAKTYFPIIEKVFEEERVPDDFKYLALQESALIADAVSVSNAVGFWQFKDYTAVEMGLRVDKEIDERLNIVSSSRAAARYIKKNNFYFNNWIFALQAYQMGAGGAMKSLPKNLSGAKHMEITSATYWYVKKYLAHKVAFEDVVDGTGQVKAIPYENHSTKLLTDIAKEVSVNEEELKSYNKWTKTGRIPDDRTYTVIIPVPGEKEITLPLTAMAASKVEPPLEAKSAAADRSKINGIKAIKALPGETPGALATRAGVVLSDFVTWNDISKDTHIEAGQYYLLG